MDGKRSYTFLVPFFYQERHKPNGFQSSPGIGKGRQEPVSSLPIIKWHAGLQKISLKYVADNRDFLI